MHINNSPTHNDSPDTLLPHTSSRTNDGQTIAFIASPDALDQSLRNSPEPPQDDFEGHYVGPSSGVSFLLRAQKRVHASINFEQSSSIFTFGDTPLPKCDTSFFHLPARDEAQKLIAHYFDFAYPTHRFLHRPTIDRSLDEFYDTFSHRNVPAGVREQRALLLAMMASAMQFSANSTTDSSFLERYEKGNSLVLGGLTHASSYFFAASEHYLAAETGRVRLASVQARLAQCFYLTTQSRINHCWSLFGTTVRLAFAIGLHRKRRGDASRPSDPIEEECRRRTFWCAYSLDNYLSVALGRPRGIHDEDIDQVSASFCPK